MGGARASLRKPMKYSSDIGFFFPFVVVKAISAAANWVRWRWPSRG
jgi:hypothetical protein